MSKAITIDLSTLHYKLHFLIACIGNRTITTCMLLLIFYKLIKKCPAVFFIIKNN